MSGHQEVHSDPIRGGRNACPCGAAYRPYFGQWWRTGRGSVWVCSPACVTHVTPAVVTQPATIDPMPNHDNALRIERAATLAEQYAHDTGLDITTEPFTVVTDIVADLLHYLASTGETNPIPAVDRGIDHFIEEN